MGDVIVQSLASHDYEAGSISVKQGQRRSFQHPIEATTSHWDYSLLTRMTITVKFPVPAPAVIPPDAPDDSPSFVLLARGAKYCG